MLEGPFAPVGSSRGGRADRATASIRFQRSLFWFQGQLV